MLSGTLFGWGAEQSKNLADSEDTTASLARCSRERKNVPGRADRLSAQGAESQGDLAEAT